MLVKPAKSLVNINKPLQQAIVAGKSVFGLINEEIEENKGNKLLETIEGDIEFKDVSFSYNKEKSPLKNINLLINRGETIALVGSTGSGKTTLVNLLARFYKPTKGEITIDETNIEKFELESFRSNISFVDQHVRLFNDTIKQNIALGQGGSMPNESVINAAKVSNSLEFIEKLDNQFDTEIGEDGEIGRAHV